MSISRGAVPAVIVRAYTRGVPRAGAGVTVSGVEFQRRA